MLCIATTSNDTSIKILEWYEKNSKELKSPTVELCDMDMKYYVSLKEKQRNEIVIEGIHDCHREEELHLI